MLFGHYTEISRDVWRWRNFSPHEIASKDRKNPGEILVNEEALDALQRLRDDLGKPLIITSAYRSRVHNRAVGSKDSSQHRTGGAFDVSMQNHDPAIFEEAARRAGFRGFGFYPRSNFIHIDMGHAREWGSRWRAAEHEREINHEPTKKTKTETTIGGLAVGSAGAAGAATLGSDEPGEAAGSDGGSAGAQDIDKAGVPADKEEAAAVQAPEGEQQTAPDALSADDRSAAAGAEPVDAAGPLDRLAEALPFDLTPIQWFLLLVIAIGIVLIIAGRRDER